MTDRTIPDSAPDLSTRQAWLPAIRKAVLAAGDAIMAIHEQGIDVRHKADASPVTEADEAAERILLATLHALEPALAVVAEESMSAGNGPNHVGRAFWLVDPLDGTREFINRRTDFTVNVGLVIDGAPVFGMVFAPARGLLYWGDVDDGAWCSQGGSDRPVSVRPAPLDGLVAVASKSHRTPETDTFLNALPVADSQSAGSSLKFCLVAEGAADIYPRFGPTMEWDTAAGDAVLRAAGGAVLNPDGSMFRYGKAEYRNGNFIARGDATLDRFIPLPA